jgi:menaquinone-9 beta-reductase
MTSKSVAMSSSSNTKMANARDDVLGEIARVTALLLARAGARVLVIDKGVYGSDTLSTHALMRGAVMQLHRWGVLSRIRRAATPAVRSTSFTYPAATVTVAIEPRYGVDALYAPRRTVLDRALVDEATLAGAEFAYRAQFTDMTRDEQGRVRGVSMRTTGGVESVSADLVVGADGLRSLVAHRTAAREVVAGSHATATLYSYWRGLITEGYEWHYAHRASVGAIPTNDATCVFVSIPAADLGATLRTTPADAYIDLLRTHFPEFAVRVEAGQRVEPVRGFAGHRGYIKQSAGPGWALVGDAGYFKDPLTAHGITDALRDAELLARAALSATDAALVDYDRQRRELSQELFSITDRIASFTWTDEELQALHRGFSREMSREQRVLADLEPLPWQSSLASAPLGV